MSELDYPIFSMGDRGSHSTEKALTGAIKNFTKRVVILIQKRIPSAWLFEDDSFIDTTDGMLLNSKITMNKDETSGTILEFRFIIKDMILDHGFIEYVSNGEIIANIPTGNGGSQLTNKTAESLVFAVLGGML